MEALGGRLGRGRRRPHAPGVWLVYFTLASLPVFGLGQWFVPAVEEDRRGWLFVYFLAYIASGMGLLLATSFLNLRRYLRQRKVKMPAAMTATWLSTGAILIVGLTVLAAVLPLPGAGSRVDARFDSESSDLRASKYRRCSRTAASRARGPRARDRPRRRPRGKQPRRARPRARARPTIPTPPSKPPARDNPAASAAREIQVRRPRASRRRRNPARRARKDPPSRIKAAINPRARTAVPKRKTDQDKDATRTKQDDKNASDQKDDNQSQDEKSQNDSSTPPSRFHRSRFEAPGWLRMLVIAAGVIALIYGLFRYGAVLLDALRELLASLFGGLFIEKKKKRAKDDVAASEPVPPPRPFSSFANPFDSGLDQRFSPDDLVIYSFEALEAWAFEHDLARSPHETPTEFVRRLGQARAELRGTPPAWSDSSSRSSTASKASGRGPAAAPPVLAGASGLTA